MVGLKIACKVRCFWLLADFAELFWRFWRRKVPSHHKNGASHALPMKMIIVVVDR